VDDFIAEKLTIESALLDRVSLEHSLRFYNLVMLWLIKCASSDFILKQEIKNIDWSGVSKGVSPIPLAQLSETPPSVFAVIPEWVFEDICEFYLFILR
jgi:ubiquitin conjugation factor E4 B